MVTCLKDSCKNPVVKTETLTYWDQNDKPVRVTLGWCKEHLPPEKKGETRKDGTEHA